MTLALTSNSGARAKPAAAPAEKRAGPWVTGNGQRHRMLADQPEGGWVARVLYMSELDIWYTATENQEGRPENRGRYNSVIRAMAACDEALDAFVVKCTDAKVGGWVRACGRVAQWLPAQRY